MPLHIVKEKDLLCPITMELMNDPVQASDGHTYERDAIEEWFREHDRSPLTNEVLSSKKLVPNYFCKKTIQKYLEENNICSLDDFITSIATGDREKLEALNYLESHLTKVIENSFHHLFYAAQKGHIDCFKWLHEIGANIDACSNKKRTLLHHAVFHGQTEITKYLVAHLPDIDVKDSYNRTPLHAAAYGGEANCLKILLEHGANPIALDQNKETPLHAAAKTYRKASDYKACIMILIYDYGANWLSKNLQDQTPIDIASPALGAYILEIATQAIQNPKELKVALNLLASFETLTEDLSQQLKSSSMASESLAKDIKVIEHQLEDTERENKALNKELKALKYEVNRTKRAYISLYSNNSLLEDKIITLNTENIKLTLENQRLKRMNESLPRRTSNYSMNSEPRLFSQRNTTRTSPSINANSQNNNEDTCLLM